MKGKECIQIIVKSHKIEEFFRRKLLKIIALPNNRLGAAILIILGVQSIIEVNSCERIGGYIY